MNITLADRFRKKLGMKTQEEKVDDGLRAMRDILDEMGEHDTAMTVDEMLLKGSMTGKCLMCAGLSRTIPLMMVSKKIKEIIHDLEKE